MRRLAAIPALVAVLSGSGCSELSGAGRQTFAAANGCTLDLGWPAEPATAASREYPSRLHCGASDTAVTVRTERLDRHAYAQAARAFASCTPGLPVGVDLSRSYPATMAGALLGRRECEPSTGLFSDLRREARAGRLRLAPTIVKMSPWRDIIAEVLQTSSLAEQGKVSRGMLLGTLSGRTYPTVVCLVFPDIGSDFFSTAVKAAADEPLEDCIRTFDGAL